MGTIGELGLAIHSESAVQAAENLDSLVESGVRAEQVVNHLGETSEQAKARVLGLAKAALESSTYQETLNRAYEATAGSAAAAAREQLNQSAAMRQGAKSAADGVAAKEKVAASEKKATAAIAEQRVQLEKLLSQIDPTTAALARLGDQQRQLEKFKASGVLDPATFSDYKARLEQASSAISGFDATLNRTGMTAKATTAAMRTVPAQITDIFTSLAAGQQPMMVLLQQGGQLKDSFGGIGAAAQAVGRYVVGLINPFTLAAAAAAALGYAYYSGTKEADEYRNALILTGNAAGTNVGAMADLAKQVGSTVSTTGAAAEVLAELAGSSKIAGDSLGVVATAALQMRDATGRAVQDTVAEFAEIGKDPVAAAKKLNDQYGFLTAGVYEQIASLKDQGREQEAVKLLTDTYAKTVDSRTKEITQNLGRLEGAWNAVWGASKRAGDAVLDIWRTQGLAQQLSKAEADLADLEKRASGNSIVAKSAALKTQREQLQGTVQALKDQLQTQRNIDQAEENYRKRQRDSMTAQEGLHASYLSGLDKETKKKNDLEELDRRRAAALKGDAVDVAKIELEYSVARKKIEDDYSKKGGTKSSAVDLTSFNDADNKLKALTASFQNSMRVLDASQKTGLITQQQYAEQKSALIQKEKTDVEAAYQGEIAALESVRDKSSTTSAQRIQIDQKISDSKSKMVDTLKKLDADQEVLSIEMRGRLDKDEAAIKAFAQTVQDSLNLAQQGLDNQLAGFGLSDKDRGRLQEDLKIRQDYQKQLEKLTRDYGNIVSPSSADKDKYDRETQILKGALDQRLAKQEDFYRKEDALRGDWSNGVSRSWRNYVDEANDAAGLTESAFTNAFTGIEDVFVDFVTNGKASFKDFADSVLADLARIVFKQQIMAPLLQSMFGSTPSGGGIGQASGQMFGGGTGSGFTDILSMAKGANQLYSVANSGFGQALSSGWASGDGLFGGLQNAFSGGYGYVGSALGFGSGAAGAAASSGLAQGAAAYGSQFGTGIGAVSFPGAAGGAAGGAASGAASSGLSGLGAAGYGIGGALYGYSQAGLKGAATGSAGAVGGAYAGAAIGSVVPIIGTAIGAAIGAVLGGVVGGSLFGGDWQTKDQGLSLGVENGDFAGQQFEYQKKKGGLFGKNKKRTRLSALDPEMQKSLDSAYDATEGSVLTLFDRLNVQLNDGVLDGLNVAATQISTKDKTAEQIQEEIAKWFGGVADSMVSAVDAATGAGLGGFNFESLTTFVNNLYGVNDAIRYLNVGMFDLSVSGGKMAEQLSAMAGGLDALKASNATYYDNFYSDAEKADDSLDAVSRQFKALNIALPETREGYRSMVEALDLTTEAGRAMFVTLTGLAGNAASAYSILEQRSDAAAAAVQAMSEKLIGVAGSAQSALQRAISAQQKATTEAYNARVTSLNDMVSTATENVSGLTSVGNDLGAALKALRGDSDDAVKMLRAQAQATLQSALATARSGGSLSGFTGLSDALDTVSSNNTDLYGSMEDFARDQGRTANVVAELNGINGKQLTTAEKSLKGLEDQIKQAKDSYDLQMAQYDQQLEFAQTQMDALNGIDNSIKSVADAISAMNMAVISALAGMGGKGTTNSAATNGTYIDTVYRELLGRDADKAGKDYWLGQVAKGDIALDQLAQAIANAAVKNSAESAASQASAGKFLGLPGYATGGLISGPGTGTSDSIFARLSNGEYVMSADAVRMFGTGLLDQMNAGQIPAFATGGGVGEVGPQLEVTGPSRIYSANQAGSMRSDGSNFGSVVAELRALRTELESIKANTQAGALSGGKLVRIVDRVTDGGNAMLTKELA